MTPEERERIERIERHIEFLAQNQAQLTASTATLTQDSAAVKQDLVELARILQQHVISTESRYIDHDRLFRAPVERLALLELGGLPGQRAVG